VRFGILLILLQSFLLCAEGRAESVSPQLEPADKTVSAQLLDSSKPAPDDSDPEPALVAALDSADTPLTYHFVSTPSFAPAVAVVAAHLIRGPPAR
jgi:hypothetical protein